MVQFSIQRSSNVLSPPARQTCVEHGILDCNYQRNHAVRVTNGDRFGNIDGLVGRADIVSNSHRLLPPDSSCNLLVGKLLAGPVPLFTDHAPDHSGSVASALDSKFRFRDETAARIFGLESRVFCA